jgi:glycosyltransferase involved in cell wall biosynthesis
MRRLAFLVDSPSRAAHGNAASRLALGLLEDGRSEIDLVCYSADPPPTWLPPEVQIHRLGVERASRALVPLVRYLRDRRPDVLITRQVHANFVGLAAGLIGRYATQWRGRIIVVQDHLPGLVHASNRLDNKWVAKAVYRFADGLIAPSPTVLADTVAWCGLDPATAVLVPNAIPQFTTPLSPPPHPWLREGEPPVFVNVTNLLPFKRVGLLVDAFSRLRVTHEARLLVLGDGPCRAAIVGQIRELGLEADAAALGWIDDPRQYVARSWALVHPSDEDGFAQVLTEAMSVGCPVITADSLGGGPRFVTDDGTYGILHGRGDEGALVDAMTTMLDGDVRARYSALGRQRADVFSPVASARALTDFVDRRFGSSG